MGMKWQPVSSAGPTRQPNGDALVFIPAWPLISEDDLATAPTTLQKPRPSLPPQLALREELAARARHLRNRSRCKEASLIEAELRAVTMQILGARAIQ
jgi:hypothetical protein